MKLLHIVAKAKLGEAEEDHLLEHFHPRRTIRKLILDFPAFAPTLLVKALEGKCAIWSQGHSSKVISGFLDTLDAAVQKTMMEELQPWIETGALRLLAKNESANIDRVTNRE